MGQRAYLLARLSCLGEEYSAEGIAAPRGSLNKLAAEEDSSIPHKLDTIIFEKMDMILAKMEKVDGYLVRSSVVHAL